MRKICFETNIAGRKKPVKIHKKFSFLENYGTDFDEIWYDTYKCIKKLDIIWLNQIREKVGHSIRLFMKDFLWKVGQFPKIDQKYQKPSLFTDLVAFAYTIFLVGESITTVIHPIH